MGRQKYGLVESKMEGLDMIHIGPYGWIKTDTNVWVYGRTDLQRHRMSAGDISQGLDGRNFEFTNQLNQ
jgi:hypothetical protein